MPYTITVKQTAPNAVAEHVVVTDVDFPAGFSIDSASYAVSGIDRPYSISNVEGGFKFTTDQLKYGETVTIQFNSKADKSLNGKVVPNTVKASADFCEDKTASTSAYINSPKMHVDKTVTKHTGKYNVGDKVNYKITLTQINEGCFMRDIWLDDVLETKGVTFDRSSLLIMNADHDELVKGVDYNIKWWYEGDEITGFALQFIGKYANMGYVNNPQTPAASDARGAATGAYSNLNLIDKIIITYSTTIENADLAGKEIKNTASSPATPNTNGDKIRDDDSIPSGGDSDNEVVTPQTPVVEVDKTADKTEFNPGDTGSYTVTLKNTTVNTTATKIVFKDAFDTKGIKYQLDTVKVTLDGKDITKNCKTTLSEDGLSMTVTTNTDLPYGSVMQLTYDVKYGADMEAGTDITNKVTAVPENAPSVDADYAVHLINPPEPEEPAKPQLSIQKAVDKTSVTVGESANYTVTVSETVKDAAAHQVVIEDALDTEGVAIQAQSIKVALDGKDITDSCTITVAENKLSYTIETHQDMTDSNKIVVTYTVDFKNAELAGKNVTNVAVASSPDTPPVTTTVDVPVEVPAELIMDKSVDKETYKAGDILHYTITTTAKNGTVENVVITDTVNSKKLEYSKNIKVLLGETDITDSCKITYSDYSFMIETGKDLAEGETITVTYSGKAAGNQNIVNTATATGDNVDEQSDTCTVTPVLPPAIHRNPGGGTSPHTGSDNLPLFAGAGLGAAGLSILLYLGIKKKHALKLAKAAMK